MGDVNRQLEINKFLEEGLNLYGLGKFSEAIERWRKVLDIDPENTEAKDYIESAGGQVPQPARSRPVPRPSYHPPPASDAGHPASILREAKGLAQRHDYEGALTLLEKSLEREPDNIETQSFFEMLKGRQMKNYIQEAGRPEDIPTLLKSPGEFMKFNLTKEAGFILSLIDGRTTLDEVISLSGMDKFSAYRNIVRLKRLGIIS